MRKDVVAFFLFGLITFSCNKGSNSNPSDQTVSISFINPTTGNSSTIVTIMGKNFSPNIQDNIVKVNGVTATVITARTDQLVITIPLSVGTGVVSVTVNGKTANGPVFTYIESYAVSTLAGNGVGELFNGASTTSPINSPVGITVDNQGNVYLAEYNRIKKITPSGSMSVLAGSGLTSYVDTSVGLYAQFKEVYDVAVDQNGNIYAADRDNECIRKITPGGSVSTLAGSPAYGYVDSNGVNAKFMAPVAVAVDLNGNVYVCDHGNNRVRKITPAGVVSTLAGNGVQGIVNGPGNQAEFFDITGIAVDMQGNVYVAENFKSLIRKITPTGYVSTLAGLYLSGYVNGNSATAQFDNPTGVAVDSIGNVYVSESSNADIRKITPSGDVTWIAGSPEQQGFADGPAETAKFYYPNDLFVDKNGNIYVADRANNRIRKVSRQ